MRKNVVTGGTLAPALVISAVVHLGLAASSLRWPRRAEVSVALAVIEVDRIPSKNGAYAFIVPAALPRLRPARSGDLSTLRRLVDQTFAASRSPGTPHGKGIPHLTTAEAAGAEQANLRQRPYDHRFRDSPQRFASARRLASPDNQPSTGGHARAQDLRHGKVRSEQRRSASNRRAFRGPSRLLGRQHALRQLLPLEVRAESLRGQAWGPEPVARAERMSRLQEDGAIPAAVGRAVGGRATAASLRPGRRAMDVLDRAGASAQRVPDRLDLIRPKGTGADSGAGFGSLAGRLGHRAGKPLGRPVWLTTQDNDYVDYFRKIHQRIHPLWRFPKELEVRMEQGEVLVEFALNADGSVAYVQVRRSSGYAAFDANAVAAVRSAGPFDPLPRHLGRHLRVVAPFEFSNPLIR